MKQTTVLILGSGIAGLTAAIQLAEQGIDVTVLTKTKPEEGATQYAQGGIASVWSSTDSYESHRDDTFTAGAGLCHTDAVDLCVKEGPAQVRKLIQWGVEFSKQANGKEYDLHKEGGHQKRRILHHQDTTGKSIQKALLEQLRLHPKIQCYSNQIAIDLITTRKQLGDASANHCLGVYALNQDSGEVETWLARATVLATGGMGKVYLYTSNPSVATGDGVAMAYRAGARVANLEFMQFHPTCLFVPGGSTQERTFLISEALRGEGALIKNLQGETFVDRYHPQGSLAPRDSVARAIDFELKKSGERHVYLDATSVSLEVLQSKFPAIYEMCQSMNLSIEKDYIPVVPAAHYSCGGVWTDLDAKTSVDGLYAIGEVACTGLHGANRLASNSLLEGIVFSKQCVLKVASDLKEQSGARFEPKIIPAWRTGFATPIQEKLDIASIWKEIRTLMWNYVGIVRSQRRLFKARKRLEIVRGEVEEYYWEYLPFRDLIELRNLCLIAELIISSGMMRKESRGLHYNVDYPNKDDRFFLRDTVL